MQGGELPSGSGLVVWICKHLIKLRYKPCPCYLFCLAQVEDRVDPLGGPGACSSSFHVRQDKQDIAVLIWELRVPHTELKWSRLSWVLENGEGVATLGGFGVGTGEALGWGGGGDWCRQGDMQCHALSTQTTQDSPGAEPRRSKRKLRQIFGIKLNRQLILFQTHRLVAGTQAGHRHPNWSQAPKLQNQTQ